MRIIYNNKWRTIRKNCVDDGNSDDNENLVDDDNNNSDGNEGNNKYINKEYKNMIDIWI